MKKILIVLLLCGFAISASAAKLDDFENYGTGTLDSVASPPWEGIPEGNANAVIVEDTGNKYVNFKHTTTSNSTPLGFRNPNIGITEGQTKTLFFRVKPLSGLKVDHHVGLVDSTAVLSGTTSGSDWTCLSSWTTRMGVTPGTTTGTAKFIWRASGTTTATVLDNAAMNRWYNVWLVYYTATDKADMYVNTGTDSATAPGTAKVTGQSFYKGGGTSGNLVQLAGLAFRANGTMGLDDIYMADGVDLSNPAGVLFAHNPTPANGAINIGTSSTLSWNTAKDPANPANPNPNVTKHYVSFKKGDPNFASGATLDEVSPASTTSWTPPTAGSNAMDMNGTYYWRIDESVNNSSRTDPNTIVGSVWSFSTLKSIPQITQQPTAVRALAGTSAQLSVKFTSFSPAVVTWKKYVDGTNDTTVATDTEFDEGPVGVLTSTFTFASLARTDDGRYYCLIVNAGTEEGTPVQSNIVTVIANRLMASYKFDDTLAPTSGIDAGEPDAPTGQGKTVAGVPDANSLLSTNITLPFITGVNGVGKAVSMTDPNQYVDFGTAGYPKAGSLPGGIGLGLDEGSILCWVKPTNSQVIYTNYNDGSATGFALSLTGTAADGRINVRGESGVNVGTISGKPDRPGWTMLDGAWHLLAATWKPGGTMKIFVDGQLAGSVTAAAPTAYAAWQKGVLLGAARNGTNRDLLTALFSGAVDNLRIFNYEQDANAIAQEYVNGTGIYPCISPIFDGSVYNYDNTGTSYCKVDFADFAVFAKQWLECGLYPSCQ